MHLIELAIIFREIFDFLRMRGLYSNIDVMFDVTSNQWVCGPKWWDYGTHIQIDIFFCRLNIDGYDTDDTDGTDGTDDTDDLPALIPDCGSEEEHSHPAD